MTLQNFEKYLSANNIYFEKAVDLKKKTWIHRGGIAKYFVIPVGILQLQAVISLLYQSNIKFLLIGCTSNLYIRNSTDIPVVVSTLKCNKFAIKKGYLECECGLLVSKLAHQMIDRGIKGFEYLTKLPGTVGAAIYNNSSVINQLNSISSLLIDVDLLTPNGNIKINADKLQFEFRSSALKRHILDGIVLSCRLRAEIGDMEILKQIAYKNETERKKMLEGPTQNLGCTVHMMFCNGRMPKRYRLPLRLFSKIASFFINGDKLKRAEKKFLLTISGYKRLIPYISDRQMITFVWRDDAADDYFQDYLKFMRDVCKTDKVEIEII